MEALVEATEQRFGPPDIVFANAGIGSFAPIVDADLAEWMRVLEVNLVGPLLTIKHAARRMPDGGSIIVTASLNAVQPAGGMSAYCCSEGRTGHAGPGGGARARSAEHPRQRRSVPVSSARR